MHYWVVYCFAAIASVIVEPENYRTRPEQSQDAANGAISFDKHRQTTDYGEHSDIATTIARAVISNTVKRPLHLPVRAVSLSSMPVGKMASLTRRDVRPRFCGLMVLPRLLTHPHALHVEAEAGQCSGHDDTCPSPACMKQPCVRSMHVMRIALAR